ncbi:MAG: hypothetical protein ACXVGH_11445, partial [Mycobacteriales bacterium]
MSALARRVLAVLVPLLVLGVAAGRSPLPVGAGVAVALGAGLSLAALRRPTAALVTAVAVVCLVPYYDGRLVGRSLGLTPMAACCLVLLPAAWQARGRLRLGLLDGAVALLVLLRCAALVLNFSGGVGAVGTVLLQVALPYAVFRVLALDADVPRRLAPAVVGSAAVLSLVGIAEHAGRVNPFFTLLPAQYQAAQWARPETRDHSVRAEASFGHPIAFGMFLAVALVLAVALALTAERLLPRLLLLAAAAVVAVGLADTLSRGPLLAAGLGLLLWLVAAGRRVDPLRLAAAVALAAGLAVASPVPGIVDRLVSASSTADSREAVSAQYRLVILDVVQDPAQFSLLGRPNDGGPVTDAVYDRTGLKSIDSEFALDYLSGGLLVL